VSLARGALSTSRTRTQRPLRRGTVAWFPARPPSTSRSPVETKGASARVTRQRPTAQQNGQRMWSALHLRPPPGDAVPAGADADAAGASDGGGTAGQPLAICGVNHWQPLAICGVNHWRCTIVSRWRSAVSTIGDALLPAVCDSLSRPRPDVVRRCRSAIDCAGQCWRLRYSWSSSEKKGGRAATSSSRY